MIRFISTEDTLPLRSAELRSGLDPELCRFENDDAAGTFHAGYYQDERLTGVATFHKVNRDGFAGEGYQLRGMVTSRALQGKGIGNQLLNFCIVYLRGQKVDYLWCNAREVAWRFYLSLGFEFISDAFELPNIGKHRVMYLKLR